LLVHCTRHLVVGGGRPPLALRVLDRPALVRLGHFSYSLYLSHLPVVALCYFGVRALAPGPVGHLVAMLVVSVPASVGVAYAFHLAVERRFMRT
jgi:peptidoglycan/LPS O-acetylase OafA/YrhL